MSIPAVPRSDRHSISDFVMYIEDPLADDDDDDRGPSLSVWARHEDGTETPIIYNTNGLTAFASANSDFHGAPAERLRDEFYEQLGLHLCRLLSEGGIVLSDFWAWLPEDMPEGRGWVIYETLSWVTTGETADAWELQELCRRGLDQLEGDAEHDPPTEAIIAMLREGDFVEDGGEQA